MTAIKFKTAKVADLVPYAQNSRTHSPAQIEKIAASIKEFGFINPVITDGDNGIIAGHGRIMAAQTLGIHKVPTVEASHLTEAQRRAYVIADNRLALDAGWDDDLLKIELDDLKGLDFDLSVIGFDNVELEGIFAEGIFGPNTGVSGSLADRFLISPFSVLNARDGWWQDRKRAWLALGMKSEMGRDAASFNTSDYFADKGLTGAETGNTSIFDPVLTELAYTWFSPVGGLVLDPFAGGSVRGIVAAKLGRKYVGVELREEQVKANAIQGDDICGGDKPEWITGDSSKIDKLCRGVKADMIFSCPPYADLEVYSDNPADISNMSYGAFITAYSDIIAKSCALLKENSFACFVVGEVRDRKGNYRNFVGDTVEAFRAAGLEFYNEAILVTAVGSLPIRANKQFKAGRKLGKTHQNVLVFVKGDGKKAAKRCGDVEVYNPPTDVLDDDGGFEHGQ